MPKLTDDVLRTLTLPEGKSQLVVFDIKPTGFAVVVGKTTRTFIVHRRIGKAIQHETIGRWDGLGGNISLRDARKKAEILVGKLADNKPTPGKVKRASKNGPTMAEACELYLAEMIRTDCRPTSIATVQREIGDAKSGYVKLWLDRPLMTITGKECRTRHEEITKRNGPHVANRVMRQVRAIWNHVAKEVASGTIDGIPEGTVFPANPVIAVQFVAETSKTEYVDRVAAPIPDEDLPAWYAAVMAIKNIGDAKIAPGVRRDYHVVVLFTGLRRSDAASLRWEHINLSDKPIASRVWHAGKKTWEAVKLDPMSMLRPSPKGGSDHAFALPLSRECVATLDRRKKQNSELGRDDKGWVFPSVALKSDTDRKTGACYLCADLGMPAHVKGEITHIAEPKEDGDVLVSPHRLRDTYISTLGKLDPLVPPTITKLLVNHSLGKGDVTLAYMGIGVEAMRPAQQRVTDYLIGKITAGGGRLLTGDVATPTKAKRSKKSDRAPA